MKCKECEDYRPFNNSAYGYCRMTMNNVSENGLCFDPSKKTNADRIRAMTDEELAEYHNMLKDDNCCPNQGAMDCRASCEECWLKWLKEEAKK